MENDILITLEGLCQTISSTKNITINLFDEKNLLLITFVLAGYKSIDDFLMDDEVIKIEIINTTLINVTIDTSLNT